MQARAARINTFVPQHTLQHNDFICSYVHDACCSTVEERYITLHLTVAVRSRLETSKIGCITSWNCNQPFSCLFSCQKEHFVCGIDARHNHSKEAHRRVCTFLKGVIAKHAQTTQAKQFASNTCGCVSYPYASGPIIPLAPLFS